MSVVVYFCVFSGSLLSVREEDRVWEVVFM